MDQTTQPASAVSIFPVHDITPREGSSGAPMLLVESIDDEAFRMPHRHAFTQLVLVEAGAGTHHIDFTPVPIRAGELHLLAPGQVHEWHAEVGLKCTALMFSEDVLDPIGVLPDRLRELLLLGSAPIAPSAEGLAQIHRLFEALAGTASIHSARHLLAALLHDCADAADGRGQILAHSSLTREFLRRVLRQPDARLTVAKCAALLSVTAGYLAEQVVADTGSTPSRILRTAVAREAQRMLSGTEMSAAQISSRLGFNEASYFSRFFRREVGCTPTEYRDLGAHAVTRARKERHAG